MPLNLLTVMGTKAATKPKLRDGGGLCLDESKTGWRYWVFIFIRNERRREMGLGPYAAEIARHGRMAMSKASTAINGKMRDDLLNETLFFSLDHTSAFIAAWVEDYNTTRPHSSLAYQTLAAYAEKFAATGCYAPPLRGSARQPAAYTAQRGIQTPQTLKAAG